MKKLIELGKTKVHEVLEIPRNMDSGLEVFRQESSFL